MEGIKCENCDSRIVYLHSRCHMTEPTWAVLDTETDTLQIICSVCKKEIITFKVQSLIPTPPEPETDTVH